MTERPVLRVISGDATPEEIAAVVAAVAVSSGATEQPSVTGTTSIWAQRASVHRHIRAMFAPSPHAWRTSFWPR